MPLQPGDRVGAYEILSTLGAGGMGVVYRARDAKLGRDVAIKMLPEDVAADSERLARFEREARMLAALNHPNIATVYGFEQVDATRFLNMEVVEGATLADRIERGPIPLEQALPLFVQIAQGLEAAHAKGIIHRDLKPANIKIEAGGGTGTRSGVVKILDFGLAKVLMPEVEAGSVGVSHSPTLTLQATMRGEILGTAAYMSPEQAQGLPADQRADIWAFGVCLLEALTGRRVFAGANASIVLASVSSDGRWLAYESNESGTCEIFVRPFPALDSGRWQVSTGGGTRPLWSRDGREIFYLDASDFLTAVAVERRENALSIGRPQVVIRKAYVNARPSRTYDVSPDGRRFLMIKEVPPELDDAVGRIVLVQNWFAELRRLAPARGH